MTAGMANWPGFLVRWWTLVNSGPSAQLPNFTYAVCAGQVEMADQAKNLAGLLTFYMSFCSIAIECSGP